MRFIYGFNEIHLTRSLNFRVFERPCSGVGAVAAIAAITATLFEEIFFKTASHVLDHVRVCALWASSPLVVYDAIENTSSLRAYED